MKASQTNNTNEQDGKEEKRKKKPKCMNLDVILLFWTSAPPTNNINLIIITT